MGPVQFRAYVEVCPIGPGLSQKAREKFIFEIAMDAVQLVLSRFPMLDKVALLDFCRTQRQLTEGVKMVMAADITNFEASEVGSSLKLVAICHASQSQHIWYKVMVLLKPAEQMESMPTLGLAEAQCACKLG